MVRSVPGKVNRPTVYEFADAVLSVPAQVTSQSFLLRIKKRVFFSMLTSEQTFAVFIPQPGNGDQWSVRNPGGEEKQMG